VKLLIDTCISGSVRDVLQAAGHDVVWTGDWLQDPGDDEILDHAHQEQRILITLDKDFGELAVEAGAIVTAEPGRVRVRPSNNPV